MTAEESDGLPLRAYLRVVFQWKWLILTVTIVALALGAAYTWTRTPLYSASAQLLYVRQVDIQNPLGQTSFDTTAQQAELEAVPVVIVSSEVQSAAEKLMDVPPSAEYSVAATLELKANGDYSNVVIVSATSPSAEVAAAAANASSKAIIDWGRDSARQQVAAAITVVQARLETMAGTAASQSDEYNSLQSSLLGLELLQASVSGSFAVITPAAPPSEPFYPDKQRGAVLALAAGLIVGLGLAFFLEQFDTRVRTEDAVAETLGLSIVGHIPPLTRKDRDKSPMKTTTEPAGPAAEAYRVLRSNLDFAAVGDDLRVLLITSTAQGEGKSVIACNLAVSMALAGRSVILVDADLRGPHVHQYLGIVNSRGVSTVIAGRDDASEALIPVSLAPGAVSHGSITVSAGAGAKNTARVGVSGPPLAKADGEAGARWLWADGDGNNASLRVLPSGPLPPNPGEMVAARRFGELVQGLAEDCDVVIVDAPAMLAVGDTATLAHWVDALVYVADPAKLRRPQLERARQQLSKLPCRKLGVVLIAANHRHGYYRHGYYT